MSVQDEDANYSLIGPPISEDEKNVYYPALLIRSKNRPRDQRIHLIKIGFKVLVYSDNDLPFIAEVRTLYKTKASKKLKFTARWFYRSEDVDQSLADTMEPNELCYSDAVNTNDVVTILSPCYIAFSLQNMPFPQFPLNQPAQTFFCRSTINPTKNARSKPGKTSQHSMTLAKVQEEYKFVYPSFPEQFKQLLRSNGIFWRQLTAKLGNVDRFDAYLDEVPVLYGHEEISLYEDIPRSGEGDKAILDDQSTDEGEKEEGTDKDHSETHEDESYFGGLAAEQEPHRLPLPSSSTTTRNHSGSVSAAIASPNSFQLLSSPLQSQHSTQDIMVVDSAAIGDKPRHSLEFHQLPGFSHLPISTKTSRSLTSAYELRVWDGSVVERCSGPLFELAVALAVQQQKYAFLVEQSNHNATASSSVPSTPSSSSLSSSRANVDGNLVIVHGDLDEIVMEAIASSPADPIGALELLLKPKLRFWSLEDQKQLHKQHAKVTFPSFKY